MKLKSWMASAVLAGFLGVSEAPAQQVVPPRAGRGVHPDVGVASGVLDAVGQVVAAPGPVGLLGGGQPLEGPFGRAPLAHAPKVPSRAYGREASATISARSDASIRSGATPRA